MSKQCDVCGLNCHNTPYYEVKRSVIVCEPCDDNNRIFQVVQDQLRAALAAKEDELREAKEREKDSIAISEEWIRTAQTRLIDLEKAHSRITKLESERDGARRLESKHWLDALEDGRLNNGAEDCLPMEATEPENWGECIRQALDVRDSRITELKAELDFLTMELEEGETWEAKFKVQMPFERKVKEQWRERAQELEAALKAVEWVTMYGMCGDYDGCPWCGEMSHEGHAPDCQRKQALKEGGE